MGVTCGRTRWIEGGGVLASSGPPALQDILCHQVWHRLAPVQSMRSSKHFLCSLPAWSGEPVTLLPMSTYGSTGHCYKRIGRSMSASQFRADTACQCVLRINTEACLESGHAGGSPQSPAERAPSVGAAPGGPPCHAATHPAADLGSEGVPPARAPSAIQMPRTFAEHLPAIIVPTL